MRSQVLTTTIPYGDTSLALPQPPGTVMRLLCPKGIEGAPDGQAEVARALDAPLGAASLEQARKASSVAIAISDKTRPVPYHAILPPLLERLQQAGVPDSHIRFLVGTGAHGPMSSQEMHQMLPQKVRGRYRLISHDARDPDVLRLIGTTSGGTPVWVNREFIESEFRIVIGNVEPHQFAGFSGGAKGVVIGLGGLATIEANHAMMSQPQAQLGCSTGNPVWEDISEAGRLIGIDFAINVVLNNDGRIARAFAGAVAEVNQKAIELCGQSAQVQMSEPADLVIASPGGYPKDINFYQSQKALGHAARAVRDGGTVILVAECREGIGDRLFEEWMASATDPSEVLARFRSEGFKLGAHKAYLLARDLVRAQVILVSCLPASSVRSLMMVPGGSLDAALRHALERHGPSARIVVMPRAASTIPVWA